MNELNLIRLEDDPRTQQATEEMEAMNAREAYERQMHDQLIGSAKRLEDALISARVLEDAYQAAANNLLRVAGLCKCESSECECSKFRTNWENARRAYFAALAVHVESAATSLTASVRQLDGLGLIRGAPRT